MTVYLTVMFWQDEEGRLLAQATEIASTDGGRTLDEEPTPVVDDVEGLALVGEWVLQRLAEAGEDG